jgi:uncharacterized protein (TIGR01244 family)
MWITTLIAVLTTPFIASSQLTKETIDGVRNYTRVDATVGCAGATEPRAMAELGRRGYRTIVNLRLPTEPNAAIAESRAAAEAAGVAFVNLPFDGSKPDPKVVDAFIETVTTKANQPVFVNCGSANRVAAVWLAKRLIVDKWEQEKAIEEAKAIGLTSAALQTFILDYVRSRRTTG